MVGARRERAQANERHFASEGDVRLHNYTRNEAEQIAAEIQPYYLCQSQPDFLIRQSELFFFSLFHR